VEVEEVHPTPDSLAATPAAAALPRMGARRLLIVSGMLLIIVGMIFGDIFAVFVLHQNAGRIGEHLLGATEAVAAGNAAAAAESILRIGGPGGFLENRGTKVDAHVHMIAFGYIALLLAIVLPYVALTEKRKNQLAVTFVAGAALLPPAVFLIYYVGTAYSPLEALGWASIAADVGGLLAIIACLGFFVGLWRHLRGNGKPVAADELLPDRSWASRALLAGGTLLVLVGFLHGAYYAGVHLYEHQERDVKLLRTMLGNAAGAKDLPAATAAVVAYGGLQGERAVHIAAHAHIIEFGTLALLLAFIQSYVFLSERWKRRWATALLLGSVGLPVFVLLELSWGLVAGGLADISGLLVIIALTGMLVGVLRYTGKLDAAEEVIP